MTEFVIGFLRREVSGAEWQQDEESSHALARQFGWSIVLMYYGDPNLPGAVINRLMNYAYNESVSAVIAPCFDHFEDGDIPALVKFADVVCARTRRGYTVAQHGDVGGMLKRISIGIE
ncbi:hypothetical protein ABZ319_00555 [Nocardia sp. NPDC005978]|uniref:hypothetical protein n=1 Tax=Nocardia sp. NPDC005978 TaxID=3156725 RepID=UPI0033B0603B